MRGLGFNAVPPYGLFHAPHLAEWQFNYLSTCLAGALGLSSLLCHASPAMQAAPYTSVFNRKPLCCVQGCLYASLFVLWLVFNCQLGQETSIGQHAAVPVPSILLYLALALPGGAGVRAEESVYAQIIVECRTPY